MNRTFLEMKTNIGNDIQDTSSATATIIGVHINSAYTDLLRRFSPSGFLRENIFSTVAGTKDYLLPRDFLRERYVFDSTNKINLSKIDPLTQVQDSAPTFGENGSAQEYMILDFPGDSPLTSSSTIVCFSSSASDTSQTVHIVMLSGGVQKEEDIVLTGTSNATGSVAFNSIISISKSADTVGHITITDGSTTLAVLSPKDRDYRAKIIRFVDTPSDVAVINIMYTRRIDPLSDDNDVPLIDAADIIEMMATAKALRTKRQYAKAADFEVLSEKAIQNYIFNEVADGKVHTFAYQAYSRNL